METSIRRTLFWKRLPRKGLCVFNCFSIFKLVAWQVPLFEPNNSLNVVLMTWLSLDDGRQDYWRGHGLFIVQISLAQLIQLAGIRHSRRAECIRLGSHRGWLYTVISSRSVPISIPSLCLPSGMEEKTSWSVFYFRVGFLCVFPRILLAAT